MLVLPQILHFRGEMASEGKPVFPFALMDLMILCHLASPHSITSHLIPIPPSPPKALKAPCSHHAELFSVLPKHKLQLQGWDNITQIAARLNFFKSLFTFYLLNETYSTYPILNYTLTLVSLWIILLLSVILYLLTHSIY